MVFPCAGRSRGLAHRRRFDGARRARCGRCGCASSPPSTLPSLAVGARRLGRAPLQRHAPLLHALGRALPGGAALGDRHRGPPASPSPTAGRWSSPRSWRSSQPRGSPSPPTTPPPSRVVRIETSGTAIAGRYTFVVAATDSRGMVAVGRQRVDVGNRPPVVSGGGRVLLPHGYDAAIGPVRGHRRHPRRHLERPGRRSGDPARLHLQPVRRRRERLRRAGARRPRARSPSSCPTRSRPTPRSSSARACPGGWSWSSPTSNGARASAGWDVEVTNRPPRLVAAVATASVDHTYEASFQRYAAQAALSTWVDDDGDPLLLSVGGDPACTDVVERQGTAWVTCSTPVHRAPRPRPARRRHPLATSRRPTRSRPARPRRRASRSGTGLPGSPSSPSSMVMPCVADRVDLLHAGLAEGHLLEHDFQYRRDLGRRPPSWWTTTATRSTSPPAATGGCLSAAAVPQPCAGAACSPVLTLCGNRSACGAWTARAARSR